MWIFTQPSLFWTQTYKVRAEWKSTMLKWSNFKVKSKIFLDPFMFSWNTLLSSVALNCQDTMIIMNPSSQLSKMSTIWHKSQKPYVMSLSWAQKSQGSRIALWRSSPNVFVFFGQVMSPHHSDQMSQRSQVARSEWQCHILSCPQTLSWQLLKILWKSFTKRRPPPRPVFLKSLFRFLP